MEIVTIHSYLVHPAKNEKKQPVIGGVQVPVSGKLFPMLKRVFDKSETECNIEIAFCHNSQGKQQNDCRDLLVKYAKQPSLESGRLISERLQRFTTNKSGLGLLFLIVGQSPKEKKLLISRFPANNGIIAEENDENLSVEFIEKVFMKSATSYKAAVYRDALSVGQMWSGKAIDKQINSDVLAISNYWIRDFLDSDFLTTSASGTKRLGVALRNAMKNTEDVAVKEEIAAVCRLSKKLNGKTTSIQKFADYFGLTPPAQELLKQDLAHDGLFTEQFVFAHDEFSKQLAFRSVELGNGAILTGDAEKFEKIFKREHLPHSHDVRFTTQAPIVNERIKKGR